MNIQKKSFTVSVRGSKNYQSVELSQSFDVLVDDSYDEFSFQAEQQRLKDQLIEETNNYLDSFVSSRKKSDSLDID